ncbi:MAG: hypothetical protein C0402_05265 [Thermodesulfovibrio sp.]|nr:hypothetical protein [Thermodesulfovibrio sp.]
MAESENIRERVKRLNPAALELCDEFEKRAAEKGSRGASVITTDDMTPEEEELALFEGFLKEGHEPATALLKAKQWLSDLKFLKR